MGMLKEYNLNNSRTVAEEERIIQENIDDRYDLDKQLNDMLWQQMEDDMFNDMFNYQ